MDKVVRIEHEINPTCPNDDGDGQWTLYSFNRNSIHYKNPWDFFKETKDGKLVPENIGLHRKLKVGLAFVLQYYEHSLGRYDIQGHGPQCQWDTSNYGGILVWENKPRDMGHKKYEDRQKDAEAFLETYNAWMNGWVYWCSIESPDGEFDESCGGFYDDGLVEYLAENLEKGDRVKLEGDLTFLVDDKLPAGVELVEDFDDDEDEAEDESAA